MDWRNPFTIEDLRRYCGSYGIPFEHLPAILEDLKVLPMLRGKGLEYFVYDKLRELLSTNVWEVRKPRVNPQPGSTDADLLAVHRTSGIEVIVETKTPVRASFHMPTSRKPFPNFKVKCHKSRSNTQEPGRNDRYLVDEFDIIVTNCENAFRASGEEFGLIETPEAVEFIQRHYKTRDQTQLISKLARDLRCVVTTQIVQTDDTLPRTPEVRWEVDPKWRDFGEIESLLNDVVRRKEIHARRRPSQPAHRRSRR